MVDVARPKEKRSVNAHTSKVGARWVGAIALATTLLLTGCTGAANDARSPSASALSPVAVAQANVDKAQKELDAANAAATDASAAFCTAATDYVTAIDRYGDVITKTGVTVGDVRTGGADLKDPSDAAMVAGKAVTDTRDAVVAAQQNLTDAQNALAAAQAEAAGEPAPDPVESETPAEPILPTATVDRISQAEADFATASGGIDDGTPLTQAAEEFNSAAVALEMAWIQLVVQSGCLSDEQQVTAANSISSYTLALQQQLANAGYYTGPIDGIYGPLTVAAVKALQAEAGLPQTGTMDKATEEALRAKLAEKDAAAATASLTSTAALQQTLKLAGYWDGPIDGLWSPELTAAVGAAQKDLGVPVTGTVDAVTIAAFQAAVAAAKATPEATPEPSETTEG